MLKKSCGLVGLPSVGKSCLFNALAQKQLAASENFPFTTIDPNKTQVIVPDKKLRKLAEIAQSQRIIESKIDLFDIAGLIKGASEGQGLGNKFLANIRECSIILHVLRCWHDPSVIHVSHNEVGETNPIDDLEIVETELLLADLTSIEKRLGKKRKQQEETDLLMRVKENLEGGIAPNEHLKHEPQDGANLHQLKLDLNQNLLSSKPVLFICNTDEKGLAEGNEMTKEVDDYVKSNSKSTVDPIRVCAKLEEEAFTLFDTEEEREEYFQEFGLEESVLGKVAHASQKLLGMETFYTVGEQEARAWPIIAGSTAPEAAGRIHTDMQKGFICADTMSFDDYCEFGGEQGVKSAGKLRQEGRDYVVQEGDIMSFKFN